jgi:hypothetical protein
VSYMKSKRILIKMNFRKFFFIFILKLLEQVMSRSHNSNEWRGTDEVTCQLKLVAFKLITLRVKRLLLRRKCFN